MDILVRFDRTTNEQGDVAKDRLEVGGMRLGYSDGYVLLEGMTSHVVRAIDANSCSFLGTFTQQFKINIVKLVGCERSLLALEGLSYQSHLVKGKAQLP